MCIRKYECMHCIILSFVATCKRPFGPLLLNKINKHSVELITVNTFGTGIVRSPEYTTEFKIHRQLCLSILKRFGFGQKVMETRILTEVEEMIARIRAHQGRSFDGTQLIMSCITNVIMSIVFGRRFDNSNPEFQRMISETHETFSNFPVEEEIFPILRYYPVFKKREADNVARIKRNCDYISLNIAACHEVCRETSHGGLHPF